MEVRKILPLLLFLSLVAAPVYAGEDTDWGQLLSDAWFAYSLATDPIAQTQHTLNLLNEFERTVDQMNSEICRNADYSYTSLCDPYISSSSRTSGSTYSSGYSYRVAPSETSSPTRTTKPKREDRLRKEGSKVHPITGKLYTYIDVPDVNGMAGKSVVIEVLFNDSDGNLIDGSFFIAVKPPGGEWKGLTNIVAQNGIGKLWFEIPVEWSGTGEIKATFREFPEDWMRWELDPPRPEFAAGKLYVEEPSLEFELQANEKASKTNEEAEITLLIKNPGRKEFNGRVVITQDGSEVADDFKVLAAAVYEKFGSRVKGRIALHIGTQVFSDDDVMSIKVIDRDTNQVVYSKNVDIGS